MYSFPKSVVWKIYLCVSFFLILLLSRDTLITSSILGFYKATFIMYGIIALCGTVFIWNNRYKVKEIIKDDRMLVVVIALIVFLTPMFVKLDWQLMYLSVLLCICFPTFLSFFVTTGTLARAYVVMISFLGLFSCISNYILMSWVDNGLLSVPVFSNGVHNFYNFVCSCVPIDHPQSYRNFGIFREPGVYQFFIIFAMILNNYFVNWDKSWKIWGCNIVLTVTMLTTFATGGIIEIALLFFVLFIDKKWYTKKQAWIIVGALLSLLVAVFVYSAIDNNLLYKAATQMIKKIFNTTPTSSGGVRYQSIIIDLGLFLKNPLFGEKLSNVMYAEQLRYNTTSTMILFAGYGIFAGAFHVLSWIALLWDKNRKVWINLALLLIMFMSFNTQDLTADMFLWLFPVMAMVEKGIPFVKSLKTKKKA